MQLILLKKYLIIKYNLYLKRGCIKIDIFFNYPEKYNNFNTKFIIIFLIICISFYFDTAPFSLLELKNFVIIIYIFLYYCPKAIIYFS